MKREGVTDDKVVTRDDVLLEDVRKVLVERELQDAVRGAQIMLAAHRLGAHPSTLLPEEWKQYGSPDISLAEIDRRLKSDAERSGPGDVGRYISDATGG